MTDVSFFTFRAFVLTIMTLGMMASLTEFRFGHKKLLGILAVYSVWSIAVSATLLWLGGELLLLRLFYFTISVPAILITYWAANDTPAQAVFNYVTQILLSLLAASMIRVLAGHLGLNRWLHMLLLCAFYCTVIYLEGRFLRQPLRALIKLVPARWGVLTLIPCAFCAYLIFMAAWPDNYLDNLPQRVYIYTGLIPMLIVYWAVFKGLLIQYRVQMERQSDALLMVQIAALQEKMQKVQEVENGIRILRHDLRHQLHTVTELVARGDRETALAFLDTAQQRLDDQQPIRWCRPPVLDAVFSSYFKQAKQQGIRVTAKIALPDELPVDEGELAIVLANALENAIHANAGLPPAKREIRCKMVGNPGIMLEIANPCDKKVTFDVRGLPVAEAKGHGLGVQSISAFCQRNDAVCQFALTDGWFQLKLIL